MRITRIPAEWKHPVGKPTGEDEAARISVMAFGRGEANLRKPFTSLKGIGGNGSSAGQSAGVFCEHPYLFEGTTFCEESGSKGHAPWHCHCGERITPLEGSIAIATTKLGSLTMVRVWQ